MNDHTNEARYDLPNSHQGQNDNIDYNLDLADFADMHEDALTADQAFLVNSDRKITNSSEGEEDYAQDKDFESLSGGDIMVDHNN